MVLYGCYSLPPEQLLVPMFQLAWSSPLSCSTTLCKYTLSVLGRGVWTSEATVRVTFTLQCWCPGVGGGRRQNIPHWRCLAAPSFPQHTLATHAIGIPCRFTLKVHQSRSCCENSLRRYNLSTRSMNTTVRYRIQLWSDSPNLWQGFINGNIYFPVCH